MRYFLASIFLLPHMKACSTCERTGLCFEKEKQTLRTGGFHPLDHLLLAQENNHLFLRVMLALCFSRR